MTVHGNFIIEHQVGLHARPATLLVKTANAYESTIDVIFQGKKGNAKSLLSILGLGIHRNDEFIIRIEGADEALAWHAISELIDSNFHEPTY